MSTPLNLTCRLSTPVIPTSNQRRLVYLLMEVSGGEGSKTLPGNLGFVIDVSDSMRIRMVTDEQFRGLAKQGMAQEILTDGVPAYQITNSTSDMAARFPRRIDYVAEGLRIAGNYLRPADRFSLVAFAGKAHCLIPSSLGPEHQRLNQTAQELDYLRLGDGTNMAEGIALAYNEVSQRASHGFANRMILLTDGHTQNVSACYEWAVKARQNGIRLTTMGIGNEFNEDLLIPLADQTNGNAYYIETPEKIADAFERELGAALRISYRNVDIKILLSKEVELRRIYRVRPDLSIFDSGPNMDGSYALLLGDYDPVAPQALLLEIIFPPRPAGLYRMIQTNMVWDDPAGGLINQNLRQDVVVRVAEPSTTQFVNTGDERVLSIVEKVGAFKMGMQALEKAQQASQSTNRQEKSAATIRLREAATRLYDMGEMILADTMSRQADVLERIGNVDPDASKKLRYETRHITKDL